LRLLAGGLLCGGRLRLGSVLAATSDGEDDGDRERKAEQSTAFHRQPSCR
jgi:hypothetical protein